MQRHKDFEFNLRGLAGSMGDFGTLFPLAIGFIAVNGLDPAGQFIMLGLSNVALGLAYRPPMPLQPKKVIAVAAIAQKWPPSRIYASGPGLGVTWFILVFSGALRKVIELTPLFVVRGVQLALGVLLAWEGLKMMRPSLLLGLLWGRGSGWAILLRSAYRRHQHSGGADRGLRGPVSEQIGGQSVEGVPPCLWWAG